MLSDIKAFLSSLWQKLHAKKLLKRFAWLITICLLTLLIPLTIALGYIYFIEDGQKVTVVDISTELYDSNGMIIARENTQEDILESSILSKLLYDLSTSKVRAPKPDEFSKKQTMSFTITYGEQKSTFKCYFEESLEHSYIEDQNGDFFTPDSVAYESFLNSEFSETIYKSSIPPMLYTASDSEILSSSTDWNYLLKNGKTVSSDNFELATDIISYPVAGAIDLEFSRKPDKCNVTIQTANGEIHLFESLDSLASFNASEGDKLLLKIDAEWESNESDTSFGKQSYDFTILCTEPSKFTLSETDIVGGEFIIISISNVESLNSISYTSKIPESHKAADLFEKSTKEYKALNSLYNYQPIFAKCDSLAYALLPIPAGIPDTKFEFSLSCGISRADFTLNLKAPTLNELSIESQDESTNVTLTKAQKADFTRIVYSLKHSNDDLKLFDGVLLNPEGYGFTSSIDYGASINGSFDLLANSYSANEIGGTSIQSVSAGRIIQVGHNERLGSYVIVDHGLGLATWYCGLSNIDVAEGDIVKKGAVLGKAGSSSMLCDNGFNLICSIGGIPVDPSNIVGKTIIS